jgi:hypothetical protein
MVQTFRLFLAASIIALASMAHAQAPVAIVSPKAGSTIHDNSGFVPVVVAAHAPYDAIRVLLDGKQRGPLRKSVAFSLENVHRGEHELAVELLRSGRVVASSEPVVFHMWQASRLFPSRK